MKKICKKTLSLFVTLALLATCIIGLGINSNAASLRFAENETELREAIETSTYMDTIKITQDIILDGGLDLHQSVMLDLGGHEVRFTNSADGLKVDVGSSGNVCVTNGTIVGAKSSNAAITVVTGYFSAIDMRVIGGDCTFVQSKAYGNALYCSAKNTTMIFSGVDFYAGHGYRVNNERTGKAIYLKSKGCKIYCLNKGYTTTDAIPQN